MVLGVLWMRLAAAGRLEEHIACADGRSHYALYLPDGWNADREWPLLLVMDPRGRAVPGAERFFAAADTWGWVVASSEDTRSDLVGDDPNGAAIAAVLGDVGPRASIAEDAVVLAGFSGTARVAWEVGRMAPELVFAVLAAGGATPDGGIPTETVPFAWFGVAGSRDFNHGEVRGADQALADFGAVHRSEVFQGPHDWPPTELAARMLGWAEVQGQRAGRRPNDEGHLDLVLAAEREHLATLTDPWERWVAADAVARLFSGLRDVTAEGAEAARLADDRDVRARRRLEDRLAAEEEVAAEALGRITGWLFDEERPPPTPAEAAFALGISSIRRTTARTDPRGDSAGRILASYAGVFGFYTPRDIGDLRRAAASLGIAAVVRPDEPNVHYNLACARALAGMSDEALDTLERAFALGFDDREWMASDPDLAALRSEPRFVALLEP